MREEDTILRGSMIQYKLSCYNWLIDENSFLILYNGFTGTLARVDVADKMLTISSLFSGSKSVVFVKNRDPQLFDSLVHGGFLIPDNFDEREYLRLHSNRAKYSGILAITSVMTTECNFACSYCYEELQSIQSETMEASTADAIVCLCKQINPKGVYVTLYGGEPLLNKDICLYLLEEINKLDNCNVVSNIVTNGYLIDAKTASSLAERGVKSAQITLDGPPEIHNAQRMLKGGGETYDVVVQNIIEASKYMKIQVRVNISDESASGFNSIQKLFEENPGISVYPAAIQDYKKAGCAIPDYDMLVDKIGVKSTPMIKIKAKQPGCIATNMTGVVILPNGQMVKCWREVTSRDEKTYQMPYGMDVRSLAMINRKWLEFNPYKPSSICYDCKMLPACGGGCPYEHVFGNTARCKYSSKTYENYIRRQYYDELKKIMDKSKE